MADCLAVSIATACLIEFVVPLQGRDFRRCVIMASMGRRGSDPARADHLGATSSASDPKPVTTVPVKLGHSTYVRSTVSCQGLLVAASPGEINNAWCGVVAARAGKTEGRPVAERRLPASCEVPTVPIWPGLSAARGMSVSAECV